MKKVFIYVSLLLCGISTIAAGGEARPKMGGLNPSFLKRIVPNDDRQITLVAFDNGIQGTNQYAFSIFEVRNKKVVFYLFQSAVIEDWVCHDFSNKRKVASYFALRFRGIANDLEYGRERPDVESTTDELGGSLLPLVYLGYAKALDKL